MHVEVILIASVVVAVLVHVNIRAVIIVVEVKGAELPVVVAAITLVERETSSRFHRVDSDKGELTKSGGGNQKKGELTKSGGGELKSGGGTQKIALSLVAFGPTCLICLCCSCFTQREGAHRLVDFAYI